MFSVYIPNIKKFTNLSYLDMRKPSISEDPKTFKAKQIIMSYDVAILSQMRKESRYLMDKFILRCTDGQIWHPYISKLVDNTQFHIFTVFDIPNLNKYSNDESKIKGIGFVYGIAFKVNVWAYLADEPLPEGFIEQIEMNIKLHNDPRINKIMIN